MNYVWKTHSQTFIVDEASTHLELTKDKSIKDNADDYFIIFNICEPKYRMVKKSVLEPTKIFIKKVNLDKNYNEYLMDKLDFNEEVLAREFRRYFNNRLNAQN